MTDRARQAMPVVVLISGNGSNLQALIDAQTDSHYRIAAVVCNRPQAYGLQRARDAQIPTCVIDHTLYKDRMSFDRELIKTIDQFTPGLVVLAGFMRILSNEFVEHYQGRLLNIHPSLLPAYTGLNTYERALKDAVKQHGTTVHFVIPELDSGPLILQAVVPVRERETPQSLAERVQQQEYRIYPQAVDWFAQGRLKMGESHAILDGKQLIEPVRIDAEEEKLH